MPLEMKRECERCRRDLTLDDSALICSYECTFCPDCATLMGGVCPNCAGELVQRPRRAGS